MRRARRASYLQVPRLEDQRMTRCRCTVAAIWAPFNLDLPFPGHLARIFLHRHTKRNLGVRSATEDRRFPSLQTVAVQAALRLWDVIPGKIRFDLCEVFSIELLDGWGRIHFREGQRPLERKKR